MAHVEEWEQEVHTTSSAWSISDDQLQERERHRGGSGTWFRRSHELSEQEMFACLTRAHGDVDQVMTSGATALMRRRLPTGTCQFRRALQHCGDQVESQENGRCVCVGSPSHPVPRPSGILACTEIPHKTLGIKVTDQSCHHEVWIHLVHVNAWLVDRASRDGQHRRPIVRKRSSPYDHK